MADYFFGKDGDKRYLGIMLWRRGDGLASVGDFETLDAVKKVVAQVDPRNFSPKLSVDYTGNVAMSIDEQNAIREDLTVATVICTTLVLLAIWLYFRRVAVLCETAVGRLQVARHARAAGRDRAIFMSELQALAYLGVSSFIEKRG